MKDKLSCKNRKVRLVSNFGSYAEGNLQSAASGHDCLLCEWDEDPEGEIIQENVIK